VRSWKLMHEASTVVQDQGLTDIMMKNWNSMKMWKRPVQEITILMVKEEIRKIGRLRHLIMEE
jgi:hypothetical protein